jgi:hypothetical protein
MKYGEEGRTVSPARAQTNMPETAFLLMSNCPMCGYDLQGLPEGHVCPECAFPVERESRLYGRTKYAPALRWLLCFYLLATCAVLLIALPLLGWHAILAIVVLVSIGRQALRLVRPGPPRLGISPDGLTIFARGGFWRRCPWVEVGSAQLSRVSGVLEICARDGARLFRGHYEGLGSWVKAKELVAIIERHAPRAGGGG